MRLDRLLDFTLLLFVIEISLGVALRLKGIFMRSFAAPESLGRLAAMLIAGRYLIQELVQVYQLAAAVVQWSAPVRGRLRSLLLRLINWPHGSFILSCEILHDSYNSVILMLVRLRRRSLLTH